MPEDRRPQGTVQIALRISPDLRERVKAAAEANNRSVNSELTATLEEAYPPPQEFNPFDYIHSEWTSKARDLDEPGRGRLVGKILARLQSEGIDYIHLSATEGELMVRIVPQTSA